MLNIVLILAWLVAVGLALYLAPRAVKFRLRGRQQRKLARRKIRDFTRLHRFDEGKQRWVRKDDGVVLVNEVIENRRLNLVVSRKPRKSESHREPAAKKFGGWASGQSRH
jgi:hypothetical protein